MAFGLHHYAVAFIHLWKSVIESFPPHIIYYSYLFNMKYLRRKAVQTKCFAWTETKAKKMLPNLNCQPSLREREGEMLHKNDWETQRPAAVLCESNSIDSKVSYKLNYWINKRILNENPKTTNASSGYIWKISKWIMWF